MGGLSRRLAAVVAAVALALACSVASAAPSQPKSNHISAVESAFGVRLGRSGGGAVGGRTGPSNAPTVPVGQTFNETLQLALAKGMITQAQIDAICEFKLGMYSYYWAVVGDPLTSVRVAVLWPMFGMFACGRPWLPCPSRPGWRCLPNLGLGGQAEPSSGLYLLHIDA